MLVRRIPSLPILSLALLLASPTARAQCDGPDDHLEENDTCESALFVDRGGKNLFVSKEDPDWYRVSIAGGATLVLDLFFPHHVANVNTRVRELCGGFVVAAGSSTDSDEHVEVVNEDDEPLELVIEVYVFAFSSGDCNHYDMLLGGVESTLGVPYCAASPNSTRRPALIRAQGSLSVSLNDLVLSAQSVPEQTFGLFYYGPEQIQIPFGNGYRCVSSGGSGLHLLGVETSGHSNVLASTVDLASPPSAEGRIEAGSTWNFQAWYRDPAARGHHFNFSDAVSLTFLP